MVWEVWYARELSFLVWVVMICTSSFLHDMIMNELFSIIQFLSSCVFDIDFLSRVTWLHQADEVSWPATMQGVSTFWSWPQLPFSLSCQAPMILPPWKSYLPIQSVAFCALHQLSPALQLHTSSHLARCSAQPYRHLPKVPKPQLGNVNSLRPRTISNPP